MPETTRKRGPRPLRETAPEQERRTRISVYVNYAELQIIEGFASIAKMPPPSYLRQVGLKTPPIVIPAINQEAWTKLAGAATNINQMLKHFNITQPISLPLIDVFQKAYSDGNKSLQSLAAALEAAGVVALSLEDAKVLSEFRRRLVGASHES